MTVTATFPKDPDATLDYLVDWSDWLTTGDTIASVDWEVPNDLVVEAVSHTDQTATVWLSGGEIGETHRATCRVTTTQGRIDDRTIRLRITHR